MSATIHELRQNLATTRQQYGRRSSRTAEAFQALVRAAAENGTPLDGLRHHVENEVERFFSWTIAGVDGHVYWDGPKTFFQNNGSGRRPRRWWWHHKYGNLPDSYDDLAVKCGEPNCINPEHMAKERVRGYGRAWTDQAMLGGLQVCAMRLGHSPSSTEWDEIGREPSHTSIATRFGSWANAISAAGLPPNIDRRGKVTPEKALEGIRFARDILGHWPSWDEYRRLGKRLLEAGYPATITAAMRIYGSWPKARMAAGGPESTRTEGQLRRHRLNPTSRESGASQRSEP